MEKRNQNGPHEQQSAVTTLSQKTEKANILRFLNWRRTVRLLSLTLMLLLSLTSAVGLLIGVPCLTSQAVDYSQPVQYTPQQIRSTSKGSIVNDWREFSFTRQILDSYDISSFKISAFAVDNYGQRLEMWVSVYVNGGNNDGQILYNRGWSTDSINQESFTTFPARGSNIIVYMRYRYAEGGGENPPALSMVTPARVTIDFTEAVNYAPQQTTALPSDWLETSTASTIEFPETAFTTSTYIDWDSQVSGNDGVFQSIKYLIATTFGITDTWQSLVTVMNYMNGKLPYVYAISFFCGVTGIAVWFLEK